jgi:hypothetical protein
MSSIINLSSQQLREAADLKEQIENLHKQLTALLGGGEIPVPFKNAKLAPKKKGGMSAAGKARIAAAQKARWAKIKAGKPVKKAKRKMSAAAKAKLSKLAKARWAKVKATGRKKL